MSFTFRMLRYALHGVVLAGLASGVLAQAYTQSTTTTLTVSSTSITYGSSVTFTASVGTVPVGEVDIFDNGGVICSGTLSLSRAPVTCTLSNLSVGTHDIYAEYLGGTYQATTYSPSTSSTRAVTVSKIAPTITWPTPAAIVYGTALSATQLDATASVAGIFSYSPTAGTVLAAGTRTLSVSFTPTNTADYSSATASVSLTVSRATPTITWPPLAAIAYGTALGGTQLDASSSVAGTFSYSPPGGTVLGVGIQTLTAAFTPNDTTDYNSGTISVSLSVTKATPTLSWPTPAAIQYGTALSSAQLDASTSVSGTFVYSPSAGTVPQPGTQTLSVTFTPTDTTDYNTATASVSLQVLFSAPSITSVSPTAGLPGSSVTISGSNFGSAQGSVTFNGTAASVTNWTPSSIVATVPSGSTTGNVVVSVDGYDSNGVSFTVEELVPSVVYSYVVPSGGYDADGNLVSYNDSMVMGDWTFSYDYLNRVIGATASPTTFDGAFFCWSYDSFGNRTGQTGASAAFTTGSPQCQPSGTLISTEWGHYNANNQLTGTNQGIPTYDAAGDITYDGTNYYLYDGEGRVCAVKNSVTGAMMEYIYDADGNRVAKGAINTWGSGSCDNTTNNGFTPDASTTSNYILDLSDQQLTEVDGTGAWQHTNVFAAGMLVATYDSQGVHYHLSDPLGTRRVQTDSNGIKEESYISLPYGEMPIGQAVGATEHHFTGKERDAESGNDYFGARYYASTMGRFLSPDYDDLDDDDPEPVPYADLENPQTLNLYAYGRNNPLGGVDVDGHDGPGLLEAVETGLDEIWAEGLESGWLPAAGAGGVSLGGAATGGIGVIGGAMLFPKNLDPGELTPAQQAEYMKGDDDKEHTKDARPSTKGKHEKGRARNKRDKGGEKGDKRRQAKGMFPRKPPGGVTPKGGWPPKPGPGGLPLIFLIPNSQDNSSVTTTQGPATPCGGSTGNPCPK